MYTEYSVLVLHIVYTLRHSILHGKLLSNNDECASSCINVVKMQTMNTHSHTQTWMIMHIKAREKTVCGTLSNECEIIWKKNTNRKKTSSKERIADSDYLRTAKTTTMKAAATMRVVLIQQIGVSARNTRWKVCNSAEQQVAKSIYNQLDYDWRVH